MSAEVIELPTAMTVKQRREIFRVLGIQKRARERARLASQRQERAEARHVLLMALAELEASDKGAARVKAPQLAALVLPLRLPRRRRAKPVPPTGPGAAA